LVDIFFIFLSLEFLKTPLLDRRGGRLERSDRLTGWWNQKKSGLFYFYKIHHPASPIHFVRRSRHPSCSRRGVFKNVF